jgi:nucleoporin NUP42
LKPQYEAAAAKAMEDTVERIRTNLDDAIDYIVQGKDEHPNRNDINRELSSPNNRGVPDGGLNQGASGGFSAIQNTPEPFSSGGQGFGNSPFGQPAAPQGFGQPGGFGQPATAFQSSPFGNQGAALNQPGGFGQPASSSPFASNQNLAPPQNGFGQQNGSPFDISMQQDQSVLGQPQQTNPFGQQPNGFGQISQPSGGFQSGNQVVPDDPPPAMFGMNEQQFQEAYNQARQAGGFQNGTVPMVAPKSDWMGN